ncbi:MAG TPA: glycosyltransferase [Candidatus Methylacidiphilales bacterium]|nr:glycosyltransferase [Candidatus Methylacidiphilales bacterium]
MKFLHVIHSVNPQGGGPIEGIRQLSAALLELGHRVDVLSLDAPDSPGVDGFPLPLFPLGTGRRGYGYSARVLPWLIRHACHYDFVLVNGLWQYGSFAVWRASRQTQLRYGVFPHGMLDPWFKRHYPLKHLKKLLYWPWAEYRVLRDAEVVFFTSDEERLAARESFRLYRCREHVLGYGIAPPPADAPACRASFEQKFSIPPVTRPLLFLGRIHEKKGCDLLLRALHDILSSRDCPTPPLHLIMAGPADDAYGQRMRELSRQLGLENHVTWTGMLAGEIKWGAFYATDAFILPSHQENFGVSVVEALACGLPVLISDRVNIWREISSDQAGLVETDDLAGTIRLLRRWAALPPPEKDSIRINGRLCFEKRFHVNSVAINLINCLKG